MLQSINMLLIFFDSRQIVDTNLRILSLYFFSLIVLITHNVIHHVFPFVTIRREYVIFHSHAKKCGKFV